MQPNAQPQHGGTPPQQGPQVVPPATSHEEAKPSHLGKLLFLLGFLALCAGGYYLWQKNQEVERRQAAARAGFRTATVEQGRLAKSVRLTGVTAAGKFVSLIAPQIRGSRSGRGRSGFSLAGMDQLQVSSVSSSTGGNRSAGGSSGGGSMGSGSAGAAGAADAVASSGGGGGMGGGNRGFGGSGATRAASSRVQGGGAQQKSSAGGSAARSSGASASQGADGLGSTSSQLGSGMGGPGGGGGGGGGGSFGGGGGGDFTLVLQNLVKPGSIVKKGDVVAEFDRQYMLQRLDDYKSTLETAKAQLAQQKANLALARHTHDLNVEKAKAAYEKAKLDMKTLPVLSTIDAERVKLSLEETEAQYKQQLAEGKYIDQAEKAQLKFAELEFKTLEMEYRRSEQNAERMVSRAAIDGMTVMQNIMRGSEFAQIQAGDQIYPGQFFMQIVDPQSMIINATVNQVDAEILRVGLKAKVRFDAYPGLEVPAKVVNIAAVPRSGGFRASFVREIPVLLKIEAVDRRIIPDLTCNVDVELTQENETAIAPLAGIFTDQESGKRFVYIKQGEAWIRREVEIGLENYLVASVKNLRKGDIIALDVPPKETPVS